MSSTKCWCFDRKHFAMFPEIHQSADGSFFVSEPEGGNPNVSLNQVPTKRKGRNRLHIDSYTDSGATEIDRLVKIEQRRYRQKYGLGDDLRVQMLREIEDACKNNPFVKYKDQNHWQDLGSFKGS